MNAPVAAGTEKWAREAERWVSPVAPSRSFKQVPVSCRWNVPPGLPGSAGGFISTFSPELARPFRPLPIYRYLPAHSFGVSLMELGAFKFRGARSWLKYVALPSPCV